MSLLQTVKIGILGTLRSTKHWGIKHAPQLLIGTGVAAMLTGTVFAVRATPMAWTAINERKAELQQNKIGFIETVKVAGKYYIPAATSSLIGVGCFIGSSHISSNRMGALATAAAMSEATVTNLNSKIEELLGTEQADEIKKAIHQDEIKNNPVQNENDVIVVGSSTDSVLFYDPSTGRYFMSTVNDIKSAVNAINDKLCCGNGHATYNTFSFLIGLPDISGPIGDNMGWDYFKSQRLIMKFDTCMDDKDRPCVYLDYEMYPLHV